MTNEEEVRRAEAAKRLLADPLFNESFDALRGQLLAVMESAKTDEATLKAKLCLGLLGDLKGHWTRVLKDGVLAAADLRLEEERKQQSKWWQRSAA